MQRSNAVFMNALFVLATSVTSVLAVGGNHPPGKFEKGMPGWPEGVVGLVNSQDRVWGSWVNQGDFFYWSGDASALNKFLVQYAMLTDTPLAVVLHVGEVPIAGTQNKPYDWMLGVNRRGWGEPLDPKRPKDQPGYVVTVHVWLSDRITLKALKIPSGVDVRSAGDIEKFVDMLKRKKANESDPDSQKGKKFLDRTQPRQ